jgi:nitrogen-specific signal transduction histidine kinase
MMTNGFAPMAFPPYPRRELRQHLVKMRAATNSPMPDAAMDEVVDLACHAAECRRKAMLEVIDRASDHRVSTTAVGIASSLLAHDIKILIAGLQHAATEVGLHYESTTIEGRAHG